MKARWIIVFLFFCLVLINYFDRSIIAYAIDPLEKDLGLSESDFGIMAAAFGFGYLCSALISGWMIDRYGVRRTLSLAVVIWSLATILTGFSRGLLSLCLFRFCLGIAESVNSPALLRVFSDWLHQNEKGKGIAYALVGVPVASLLGAPLISFLVSDWGWQSTFWILGMLGLLWLIPFLMVFHNQPGDALFEGKIKITENPWKVLLKSPSMLVNYFAFFTFGYTVFFALTWLPGYLEKIYGITLKAAGTWLAFPWLMAAGALLIGGFLTDAIWKRTRSVRLARTYMIWIPQLLSACCFIPIFLGVSMTGTMICFALGLGFAMMINAPIYAIQADLFRPYVGTSQGIMVASFSLAGILSPLFTGWLTQRTGDFQIAILVLVALSVLSALLLFVFQRQIPSLKAKDPRTAA